MSTEKIRIPISARSAGDGMENGSSKGKDHFSQEMSLDEPSLPFVFKKKEPKFVPYEPYKAAVKPIIPESHKKGPSKSLKKKSNQITCSINPTLAEAAIPFPLLSPMKGYSSDSDGNAPVIKVLREVIPGKAIAYRSDSREDQRKAEWEKEKLELEREIKQLKEDKKDLENQFKIQVQVNKELKKLLVASVGEDMQVRVQFLSEDKAKLAQDIVHYSHLLLEDHEELEHLSIQCDIWRSKFLASSLMVDELAKWKAMLSHKYEESLEAVQHLLREHEEIHDMLISTYKCLLQICEAFDPKGAEYLKTVSQSGNILELAMYNMQLVDSMRKQLLGTSDSNAQSRMPKWVIQPAYTSAEDFAQKVVSGRNHAFRTNILERECIRDSRNPAFHVSNSACKILPHSCCTEPVINCCSQCSGEVKQI